MRSWSVTSLRGHKASYSGRSNKKRLWTVHIKMSVQNSPTITVHLTCNQGPVCAAGRRIRTNCWTSEGHDHQNWRQNISCGNWRVFHGTSWHSGSSGECSTWNFVLSLLTYFPFCKGSWSDRYVTFLFFFLLWRCEPTRVMASSFLRFLDHTQRCTTFGRTPLDEWSDRRRDLYLTTHDTHNRQISMSPVGFEPTISAGQRPAAAHPLLWVSCVVR